MDNLHNTEAAKDAATISKGEAARMIFAAIGTRPNPCDRIFTRPDVDLVFDEDLPRFLTFGTMGLLGFVSDLALTKEKLSGTPEVKAALRICRAALDVLEPLANVPDETDETASDANTLHDLRAELHALRPAALQAGRATEVSRHRCPPLCEEAATNVEHGDVLGKWLSLSLEVARLEFSSDELSGDATESLELEDAFMLLAQLTREDERGLLCDLTIEATQINRFRAAFAQVRCVLLDELEDDFEAHVSERVKELHHDLLCIENRGRNR